MKNLNGTDYVLEIDTVSSTTTLDRPTTDTNYKNVACWVSNGMQLSIAEQETSNKCDGGYKSSVPGMGSWTFSGDGQAVELIGGEITALANFQTLALLAYNKTVFFMRWTNVDTDVVREGKVFITSYEETASNQEAYSFTATFTGVGAPFFTPLA